MFIIVLNNNKKNKVSNKFERLIELVNYYQQNLIIIFYDILYFIVFDLINLIITINIISQSIL